jgi:hypothetical protein
MTKHHHASGQKTPEYRAWIKMKYRCRSSAHSARYSNRGITICERWEKSFENFLSDMGLRPSPKHTMERKNNNLGYSPDNCCWATRKEQANNRECTKFVTIKGVTMYVSDAVKLTGLPRSVIYERLNKGFSDEEACAVIDYRINRRISR